MAREFFCVYHSYRRSLQSLSDAEIGRLIRALLEYSENGTAPDLPGKEQIAFDFMAANIDREIENCNARITAQRENGSKGGRPPKSDKNPKNPRVFSETQDNHWVFAEKEEKEREEEKEESSKEEKEEEKEKEEKDLIPPIAPQGAPTAENYTAQSSFDVFWDAYPRKVGKVKAEEAWNKLKPDEELLQKMLKAIKAWAKSEQWTKDGAQFIPHPTTWLNGRRWEDELPRGKRLSTDPEESGLMLDELEELQRHYRPVFKEGDA